MENFIGPKCLFLDEMTIRLKHITNPGLNTHNTTYKGSNKSISLVMTYTAQEKTATTYGHYDESVQYMLPVKSSPALDSVIVKTTKL